MLKCLKVQVNEEDDIEEFKPNDPKKILHRVLKMCENSQNIAGRVNLT